MTQGFMDSMKQSDIKMEKRKKKKPESQGQDIDLNEFSNPINPKISQVKSSIKRSRYIPIATALSIIGSQLKNKELVLKPQASIAAVNKK